ncbi:MAG: hypothetical protein IPM12_15430 [Flavobacteriales bacterium]|nr:hypothetical protein [Flavobacteriales bacterium]
MNRIGLYQNISVSITLATVLSVLAKLAMQHHESGHTWFETGVSASSLYVILMGVFMIFFRGKMMHDDDEFFASVDRGDFKASAKAKRTLKAGLILGYISWLCWAPAIYFLEDPYVMSWCMLAALVASTAWLITDILSRKPAKDDTPEAMKRWWWVAVNLGYAAPLVCMLLHLESAPYMAAVLLALLILDWLFLDSLLPGPAAD